MSEFLALYLAAISQSPNHVYYPAIASLDAGALTRVVSQLLGYAGLELVSLIVMLRVLRRRLRFSAFHQLGFVLVVQKMLIHGKLVGYLLSILQLPLTHAGELSAAVVARVYSVTDMWFHPGIDFTLRFVWIHNATEST
ncbi:TPA: hypothetical protein N0F65_006556 [Lagenidium giganteum]|uniref:Uncharacterized protein n=1 Tax=Lagenidium giganteum TaxID=4803 RepID=A0AAV2YPM6_9STRA|nr:TPA: hypothetical protein N0F65_006556 [Lagenidium giganteum]